MNKTSFMLLLITTIFANVQAAATPENPLNKELYNSFMRKDYEKAKQLLAQDSIDVQAALAPCSEQTAEGLILRRSVIGGITLNPLFWNFKKVPRAGSKQEWMDLLEPHGFADIIEYK